MSLLPRKEPRREVHIPALAVLSRKPGDVYAVTILDRSDSGIRIRVPVPVQVDQELTVVVKGSEKLQGKARYCRAVEDGQFHVGIQLVKTAERDAGGVVHSLR
jgi:hypothetical protein